MKTNIALLSLLGRCKTMRELKQLHGHVVVTSQVRDVILLSKLLDFCVSPESGGLNYAQSVFHHFHRPSLYMWNSMIRGLSLGDEQAEAFCLYREMQRFGYSPDHFTYPFVLRACAKMDAGLFGRCVHGRIVRSGFVADLYVSVGLVYMYVSCGDVRNGEKVFEEMAVRNVVAWSTLMAGYVDNGLAVEAIRLFKEMELVKVEPNEITMVNVLVACAEERDICTGRWVHNRMRQIGIDPIPFDDSWTGKPNVILATALLDMYGKCGSLKLARRLFSFMPIKNVASWNSMIGAYSQYGQAHEAIRLFIKMSTEGIKPDKVTLYSLLCACTQLGTLDLGQAIHGYMEKTNLIKDVSVGTTLLDMYAKVGDRHNALQIFGHLEKKDVVSWTSMILGLAMHGHGGDALAVFNEMERHGIIPDHITYIGVLSACSHAGLVEEGNQHFNSMRSVHGIKPSVEHYGCMVDLLSRSGHLVEAEKLVQSMPVRPNAAIWGALLNGCDLHGNDSLAERVRYSITQLDPQGSGLYVLLSNIYAKAGKWLRVENARELMRQRKFAKIYGQSFMDVRLLT